MRLLRGINEKVYLDPKKLRNLSDYKKEHSKFERNSKNSLRNQTLLKSKSMKASSMRERVERPISINSEMRTMNDRLGETYDREMFAKDIGPMNKALFEIEQEYNMKQQEDDPDHTACAIDS